MPGRRKCAGGGYVRGECPTLVSDAMWSAADIGRATLPAAKISGGLFMAYGAVIL